MTDYPEGSYWTVNDPNGPAVVYKIFGSTPVNWKLERVAGGRGLLVRKDMADLLLVPASEAQVRAAQAARPAVEIRRGFVVRYQHPEAAGHLYVAVKIHPDGRFDLVQLGGSRQYFPKVRTAHVTVVDAGAIEAAFRKDGGEL